MKQVRFTFDDERFYDGFADGTTWNGFDNVWITPAVQQEIADTELWNYPEDRKDFLGIPTDEHGLIPLANGYATTIAAG